MPRSIEEYYGTKHTSSSIPNHEQSVYDTAVLEFSNSKYMDILTTEARVVFKMTQENLNTLENVYNLQKEVALGVLTLGTNNEEKYKLIISDVNKKIIEIQDEKLRLELFQNKDIYQSWTREVTSEDYGKESYALYKLKVREARKNRNYKDQERNAEAEFDKIRNRLRSQHKHIVQNVEQGSKNLNNLFKDYERDLNNPQAIKSMTIQEKNVLERAVVEQLTNYSRLREFAQITNLNKDFSDNDKKFLEESEKKAHDLIVKSQKLNLNIQVPENVLVGRDKQQDRLLARNDSISIANMAIERNPNMRANLMKANESLVRSETAYLQSCLEVIDLKGAILIRKKQQLTRELDLAENNNQKNSIQNELKELDKQNQAFNQEKLQLNAQINDLSGDLTKLGKLKNDSDLIEFEQKANEIKENTKKNQEQLIELEKDHAKLATLEREVANKQLNKAEKEYVKTNLEVVELKLAVLMRKKEKLEHDLLSTTNKVNRETLRSSLAELSKEDTKLTKEKSELMKQLRFLSTTSIPLHNSRDNSLKIIDNQIKDTKNDTKKLESQIVDLKKEEQQLKDQVKNQNELTQAEEEYVQAKLEVTEAKLAILIRRETQLNRELGLTKSTRQRDNLKSSIADLKKDIELLTKEKDQLSNQLVKRPKEEIKQKIIDDSKSVRDRINELNSSISGGKRQSGDSEIQSTIRTEISQILNHKALSDKMESLQNEYSKLSQSFVGDQLVFIEAQLSILGKRAELIKQKKQEVTISNNYTDLERVELIQSLEDLQRENGREQQELHSSKKAWKSELEQSKTLFPVPASVNVIESRIAELTANIEAIHKEYPVLRNELVSLREDDKNFDTIEGPLFASNLDVFLAEKVRNHQNRASNISSQPKTQGNKGYETINDREYSSEPIYSKVNKKNRKNNELVSLREDDKNFDTIEGPLFASNLDVFLAEKVRNHQNRASNISSQPKTQGNKGYETINDREYSSEPIYSKVNKKNRKNNETKEQKITPQLPERNKKSIQDSVSKKETPMKKNHSRKIRFLRYLLNLWPIATWPLCSAWVATIVPFQLLPMMMPAVGVTFAAICLSYYIPKIINFARKRKLANKAKKLGLDPKEYVKAKEIERNQQNQGRFKKFIRRHWKSTAIILGVTTLVAGIGLAVVLPVLSPILTSATISGIACIGSVALVGGAMSLLVQSVEKFVLVRAEKVLNRRYEKSQQKENIIYDNSRHDNNLDRAFNELGKMSIELEKQGKKSNRSDKLSLNDLTDRVVEKSNMKNKQAISLLDEKEKNQKNQKNVVVNL